jgi:hypothetical protein
MSGMSAFFFAAIPYALGSGAMVWLGFFIAGRNFFNQLSQEQRRAIYVGAAEAPKSKLKIELANNGPLKITRADLDGSTVSLYFTNTGTQQVRGIKMSWQLISPDRTNLASGSEYSVLCGGPNTLEPGEKGESVLSGYHGINLDKRAAAIRFSAAGW